MGSDKVDYLKLLNFDAKLHFRTPRTNVSQQRISSQGRYDLFDTCPYIKFLYVKPTILTKLEIKAKFRAKQASFYEMQNLKTQVKSRISVSRSSLRCITFRVGLAMTT